MSRLLKKLKIYKLKNYKNYIQLTQQSIGDERRVEMLSDILKSGTFLPKTVEYRDIDEDFKRWAEEELKITTSDGKEFPTMVLYSNQRFSEYTQSWKYTDSNNNLLLNFKTVNRENNPQFGKIQGGYFNIPGENRFYLMKRQLVLDDNGSESLLDLKMHQPTAIDLMYKLTIFTTQYSLINEFNTLINKAFRAKQCYIKPNGHFMPMTLESISDESTYSIDDRQFYGQIFNIKVMAYIITENDYRVEEIPLKKGVSLPMFEDSGKKPSVDIETDETNGNTLLTVSCGDKCTNTVTSFKMDTDMIVNSVKLDNVRNNYKIYINGELIGKSTPISLTDGDDIKIILDKIDKNTECNLVLIGKV